MMLCCPDFTCCLTTSAISVFVNNDNQEFPGAFQQWKTTIPQVATQDKNRGFLSFLAINMVAKSETLSRGDTPRQWIPGCKHLVVICLCLTTFSPRWKQILQGEWCKVVAHHSILIEDCLIWLLAFDLYDKVEKISFR
jgi:hypothetical protein